MLFTYNATLFHLIKEQSTTTPHLLHYLRRLYQELLKYYIELQVTWIQSEMDTKRQYLKSNLRLDRLEVKPFHL